MATRRERRLNAIARFDRPAIARRGRIVCFARGNGIPSLSESVIDSNPFWFRVVRVFRGSICFFQAYRGVLRATEFFNRRWTRMNAEF